MNYAKCYGYKAMMFFEIQLGGGGGYYYQTGWQEAGDLSIIANFLFLLSLS